MFIIAIKDKYREAELYYQGTPFLFNEFSTRKKDAKRYKDRKSAEADAKALKGYVLKMEDN